MKWIIIVIIIDVFSELELWFKIVLCSNVVRDVLYIHFDWV